MNIAIAQLNYIIGDFEGNTSKMLSAVETAKKQGADLIAFSELATCGYPPRDFLEFDDFINRAEKSIEKLKKASKDIAIVVGSPTVNPVIEGKDLYNTVFFLYNGEEKFRQHKTLLPTYDIFDEYRYFEPANKWGVVEFKGRKIALNVCEDLWNLGNENPLYTINPMDEIIKCSPDIIINVSASPFDYNQANKRLNVLKANVDRYKIPLFYINHVGAQTELIFDGGSVVMSPNGLVFEEMSYFKEEIKTYNLDEILHNKKEKVQVKEKISLIHDALVLGVRDYFKKLGFSKAIIGLSGGLDSALTTVLAVKALGNKNVRVLLMPSQFSSKHSITDSIELADNLEIEYEIIKIEDIYNEFLTKLNPIFNDLPFNVAEENIQARIRGTLLMAVSNKFGNILLNTTNKSEMAVGYGTLYGDLAGGLSVIADIYKTEAYELARFINKDDVIIPCHIINKPPSAELRPNQYDTDSLPEYDILDKILYQYIEKRKGPKEIIDMGYEEKLVKRVLRLVNMNEFKRYQTAPVLRVSEKAFGMGRRVPIVARYLS
ncbi:MAG TPA: NAD+ synthase [Bacteroidetes bacterium]|nr:NAD+ synthase [Bacteroidota bacterium]